MSTSAKYFPDFLLACISRADLHGEATGQLALSLRGASRCQMVLGTGARRGECHAVAMPARDLHRQWHKWRQNGSVPVVFLDTQRRRQSRISLLRWKRVNNIFAESAGPLGRGIGFLDAQRCWESGVCRTQLLAKLSTKEVLRPTFGCAVVLC